MSGVLPMSLSSILTAAPGSTVRKVNETGSGGGSKATVLKGLRGEPRRVAPPSSCCASMKYSKEPSLRMEGGR